MASRRSNTMARVRHDQAVSRYLTAAKTGDADAVRSLLHEMDNVNVRTQGAGIDGVFIGRRSKANHPDGHKGLPPLGNSNTNVANNSASDDDEARWAAALAAPVETAYEDDVGFTALMLAAKYGHANVVRALLLWNNKVQREYDAKSNAAWLAWWWAKRNGGGAVTAEGKKGEDGKGAIEGGGQSVVTNNGGGCAAAAAAAPPPPVPRYTPMHPNIAARRFVDVNAVCGSLTPAPFRPRPIPPPAAASRPRGGGLFNLTVEDVATGETEVSHGTVAANGGGGNGNGEVAVAEEEEDNRRYNFLLSTERPMRETALFLAIRYHRPQTVATLLELCCGLNSDPSAAADGAAPLRNTLLRPSSGSAEGGGPCCKHNTNADPLVEATYAPPTTHIEGSPYAYGPDKTMPRPHFPRHPFAFTLPPAPLPRPLSSSADVPPPPLNSTADFSRLFPAWLDHPMLSLPAVVTPLGPIDLASTIDGLCILKYAISSARSRAIEVGGGNWDGIVSIPQSNGSDVDGEEEGDDGEGGEEDDGGDGGGMGQPQSRLPHKALFDSAEIVRLIVRACAVGVRNRIVACGGNLTPASAATRGGGGGASFGVKHLADHIIEVNPLQIYSSAVSNGASIKTEEEALRFPTYCVAPEAAFPASTLAAVASPNSPQPPPLPLVPFFAAVGGGGRGKGADVCMINRRGPSQRDDDSPPSNGAYAFEGIPCPNMRRALVESSRHADHGKGRTPLQYAVTVGLHSAARLLLSAAVDDFGTEPLPLQTKHSERRFRESNAYCDAQSFFSSAATSSGEEDEEDDNSGLVASNRILLCDPLAFDDEAGEAALHSACAANDAAMVNVFVDYAEAMRRWADEEEATDVALDALSDDDDDGEEDEEENEGEDTGEERNDSNPNGAAFALKNTTSKEDSSTIHVTTVVFGAGSGSVFNSPFTHRARRGGGCNGVTPVHCAASPHMHLANFGAVADTERRDEEAALWGVSVSGCRFPTISQTYYAAEEEGATKEKEEAPASAMRGVPSMTNAMGPGIVGHVGGTSSDSFAIAFAAASRHAAWVYARRRSLLLELGRRKQRSDESSLSSEEDDESGDDDESASAANIGEAVRAGWRHTEHWFADVASGGDGPRALSSEVRRMHGNVCRLLRKMKKRKGKEESIGENEEKDSTTPTTKAVSQAIATCAARAVAAHTTVQGMAPLALLCARLGSARTFYESNVGVAVAEYEAELEEAMYAPEDGNGSIVASAAMESVVAAIRLPTLSPCEQAVTVDARRAYALVTGVPFPPCQRAAGTDTCATLLARGSPSPLADCCRFASAIASLDVSSNAFRTLAMVRELLPEHRPTILVGTSQPSSPQPSSPQRLQQPKYRPFGALGGARWGRRGAALSGIVRNDLEVVRVHRCLRCVIVVVVVRLMFFFVFFLPLYMKCLSTHRTGTQPA